MIMNAAPRVVGAEYDYGNVFISGRSSVTSSRLKISFLAAGEYIVSVSGANYYAGGTQLSVSAATITVSESSDVEINGDYITSNSAGAYVIYDYSHSTSLYQCCYIYSGAYLDATGSISSELVT